jgi:hypothetical protein
MSMTLSFDRQGYNQQIAEFSRAAGKSTGAALREETGLLVKQFMERTPPFAGTKPHLEGGLTKGAERRGNNRVEKDIRKVFPTPASFPRFFASPIAQKMLRNNDFTGLAIFMKRSGFNFRTLRDKPMRAEHESERISRGRVRARPSQVFITRETAVKEYVKTRQKMVGFAKAGWLVAARKFGTRKLPAWVTRHVSSPGFAHDGTKNRINPSVIAANLVPWIQRIERDCLGPAINDRRAALKDKIRQAITGAWRATRVRRGRTQLV